jgi:hypothetical protein
VQKKKAARKLKILPRLNEILINAKTADIHKRIGFLPCQKMQKHC